MFNDPKISTMNNFNLKNKQRDDLTKFNICENKQKGHLPFLPGHTFSEPYKQNFHKNQMFTLTTKTCTEKKDLNEKINKEAINTLTAYTSFFQSDRLKHREEVSKFNESYPRILPQWIKYNNKVLKFDGYFNEHVVESAHENHRSRHITIFYYLCDDSIHINEKKDENSGIPQGYFLKRQRIEKENSEDRTLSRKKTYLHWKDFNLQSDIFVYGKRIRLCNCDSYTKEFYKENNFKLNEPEETYEVENTDETYKLSKVDKLQNVENISDLKEYIEVKLKGGHPNRNLKQFLQNDRKV